MKQTKTIAVLSFLIASLAVLAAGIGIQSGSGPGPYEFWSIRGQSIPIYGTGLYQHMSAEVAVQGIAQDYVTLVIAVPALLWAIQWAWKGSVRGRFLLAGTLFYFFVTYLFYTAMAMYNYLFLVYVALLGLSFFALVLVMLSFDYRNPLDYFRPGLKVRLAGGFLLFTTVAIAALWLSIIIPPLRDGSIIPLAVAHYTTLIVQGFDLGLLLPLAFVSAILFLRRNPYGLIFVPVYFVFLSLLMLALTAKVIAMDLQGAEVFPVIVLIPVLMMFSVLAAVGLLRKIVE